MKLKMPHQKFKLKDVLTFVLFLIVMGQCWYLWKSPHYPDVSLAQGRITNPRFYPDKLQGKPPVGERIEPPPPGTEKAPPPPQEGPMAPSITTYPVLPSKGKLSQRDLQYINTRYILHRWVLSDLVWGIFELEKNPKYALTKEQIRKIYPAVKELAHSTQVMKETNAEIRKLFTKKQIAYIKKKLKDQAYMDRFIRAFPVSQDTNVIFSEAYRILKEAAKEGNQ